MEEKKKKKQEEKKKKEGAQKKVWLESYSIVSVATLCLTVLSWPLHYRGSG